MQLSPTIQYLPSGQIRRILWSTYSPRPLVLGRLNSTASYLRREEIYIVSKGNFGQKAGTGSRISSFSLSTSNPIRLFTRLQKNGLFRWKAAQKHKILRPFAWIYQIGFIIHELIITRTSPSRLVASHHEGTEQRELIRKLELDNSSNI